jgi:hypothetical protein
VKLKMWTGNLDGRREGLVIAPTKVRALAVLSAATGRSSRGDFDAYWRERPVDPTLLPEVLYTRRYGARDDTWVVGKCSL